MKIHEAIAHLDAQMPNMYAMVVIAVFAVLALRGDIAPDNVMIVVTAVISFYFGTQHEKNAEVHYNSATPTPDVVVDGFGK